MNKVLDAIEEFEGEIDPIQKTYLEIGVSKELYLFDIFWMFVPIGFVIILIADLNSFQVMQHEPTVADVFRTKQLMHIFIQWLVDNDLIKNLEFLIDTMLLAQKYTTDTTSANVILLKYKDLQKHHRISISKHAF